MTPSAPCRRTRLSKDGVDTWLDKEKLLPGQDWELEIRKAARER
ncbi:MAG: toll/interleukin-1 receptor domain-containing protein [Chloroflexi bacterium]|nr:toll/interleukin-1 receptor domain-containing protein [Chloroflexota bacterium]